MKYKDIANLFPNLSKLMKNRMVLRFFHCTPEIKNEIKNYLETEEFPTYKTIISVEGNEITLSVYSLVNNYHMTVLDAYLFIDDFLQPNAKKQELLNSLIAIRVGEARPKVDVDYLHENVDPEVKKYAELLSARIDPQEQSIERDAAAIENDEF